MKKFAVSAIVIVCFFGYAIYVRLSSSDSGTISVDNNADTPTPGISETPTPKIPAVSSPGVTIPGPTPKPTPTPTNIGKFKDGTYTGESADAFYGYIQVEATVANGKITNIKFLQYPSDRGRSIEINRYADPILAQEAISAQSANVDMVSGATDSSQAFIQSLQSALDKAKN